MKQKNNSKQNLRTNLLKFKIIFRFYIKKSIVLTKCIFQKNKIYLKLKNHNKMKLIDKILKNLILIIQMKSLKGFKNNKFIIRM